MAGRSSNNGNWAPGSPATRYNVSGKNREFYTFENAPGIGAYATGGTIIDGGDGYIYHIFTGAGTFIVNRPSAAIDSVDYLIVAGGGGTQPGATAGGGGGGGLLFGNVAVTQTSYPISVGGGGSNVPGTPSTPSVNNGSPSTAFGLTATGGGGGGQPSTTLAQRAGAPGGSGGGGAPGPTNPAPGPGGSSSPTTIPRQGTTGASMPINSAGNGGGGGGGAGGRGSLGSGPPPLGGPGGPGRIAPEFPSAIVRTAIPAPVLPTWEPLVGPGGYAAGGAGYPRPSSRSTPANSGYGSELTSPVGVVGGSGIVCIRYKKNAPYSRATGGTIEPSTHPEHPGVWRHIFTSPGTFTVTDPTLQWIDYLAVGGGGGGGNGPTPAPPLAVGGGGGAGGFVSSIQTSNSSPDGSAYSWRPEYAIQVGAQMPVAVDTYPIGIGTGGNAVTAGNNTTIGSPGPTQIIAYGGGAGATAPGNGGPGGSGGGGAKIFPGTTPGSGGAASPPPLTQGNPGGTTPATPNSYHGAGGGGANSGGTTLGVGGAGWYSVLSPSAYGTPGPLTPTAQYRYFAGGGGGYNPPTGAGAGGAGGGGAGTGVNGTVNTGGGGGGQSGAGFGGVGGPGIVIIQYPE